MTWETCPIRKWLNSVFFDRAFTSEEKEGIFTVTLDNGQDQGVEKWSISGGNDTQDKVFLLSYAEAGSYFKTNKERKCAPTGWAVANGADRNRDYEAEGLPAGWWWFRSPGSTLTHAADVYYYGGLGFDYYVRSPGGSVRPAMWID